MLRYFRPRFIKFFKAQRSLNPTGLTVGIAIAITLPIGWYTMNRWLQDFSYRIEIAWWVYALAAVIAIAISILTVSYQSIKAALVNLCRASGQISAPCCRILLTGESVERKDQFLDRNNCLFQNRTYHQSIAKLDFRNASPNGFLAPPTFITIADEY